MSSEVNVLFDGPLPSAAALTRTMKELGFPLAIKRGAGTLEQHKGFLPMRLRRQDSGVEFDTFNERSAVEEIAGADIDARFTRSANFRWGGDDNEMLVGLCTAAALAKLVNGIVLNEWDEHPLSAEEAIAQARETLKSANEQQASERVTPGTRPADIKRYLAPLLRERSDLVLIGRRLVIRPVRHLLRGAYLDRSNIRDDSLRVLQFVNPLHSSGLHWFGYGHHVHSNEFEVWEPHFEPLLMASLAERVFEPVGNITSLMDFAAQSYDHQCALLAQATSLLLADERDRAAEFVRRVEDEYRSKGFEKHPINTHWERVSRDIEALCAECHAVEAEAVRSMKLESIWEPSPFPVELPPAQRTRSAETTFSTTPWISEPQWLFAEAPQAPGDVRFAKYLWPRDDAIMLLVPLSREAAEDRHSHHEDYVLAARLPNGELFTLARGAGWDRNAPEAHLYQPSADRAWLSIKLYGASHVTELRAWPDRGEPGSMAIWSIQVHELPAYRSISYLTMSWQEGERGGFDYRTGRSGGFDLTDEIRALAIFPMPEFAEYARAATRVQALLRHLGYGEVS